MSFGDIKGQDRAIEFFRNSVNRGRLSHAYIFSGPEGVGKVLLAKNLAKFLNCENPVKEKDLCIDCCNSCISCRKIEDFNHPDVHWIFAKTQSKAISIDEIRLMQKEISLKAYEGKFKVFIIQDADNMTEEAANSLLKTLEEPPSYSLIILTSTNISGLLPTIISRCQIIKFSFLGYERLRKILIDDYSLAPHDAHFLSVVSEGRLGIALRLKEKDAFGKKNRIIDHLSRGIGKYKYDTTSKIALGHCQRQFSRTDKRPASFGIFNIKDKRELATEIRYVLNWFRDILIFKLGLASSNIINADRLEGIKSWANSFNLQDLEQIITKIDEAHRVIRQNVNPKIALEVMLVEIAKCKR